jgi:hypothetical protein
VLPATEVMNQSITIQANVRIAIPQLVGVQPNLIIRGTVIVYPVTQVMHRQITLADNVQPVIQQLAGVEHHKLMMD